MSVLSRPYFHDEQAAFDFVEAIIWPQGPVCPHCGGVERITAIKPNPEKRVRYGLKKCGQCKGQFTVRMGTIFEESKLPMTKWLQAIFLMTASKKGVSAHQLHRTLEVTYKTAWFLAHRIRHAMAAGVLPPFGEGGGVVEIDETFISLDENNMPNQGHPPRTPNMRKVLSLVDRTSGHARSFMVSDLKNATLELVIDANVSPEARIHTDDAKHYKGLSWGYAAHRSVNHSAGEYVLRSDPGVHTNTVEGYFSIFKRGMRGVYQHCGQRHLPRYLAEFDFRYSYRAARGFDDSARAVKALEGVVGKRLTYRRPDERPQA